MLHLFCLLRCCLFALIFDALFSCRSVEITPSENVTSEQDTMRNDEKVGESFCSLVFFSLFAVFTKMLVLCDCSFGLNWNMIAQLITSCEVYNEIIDLICVHRCRVSMFFFFFLLTKTRGNKHAS